MCAQVFITHIQAMCATELDGIHISLCACFVIVASNAFWRYKVTQEDRERVYTLTLTNFQMYVWNSSTSNSISRYSSTVLMSLSPTMDVRPSARQTRITTNHPLLRLIRTPRPTAALWKLPAPCAILHIQHHTSTITWILRKILSLYFL